MVLIVDIGWDLQRKFDLKVCMMGRIYGAQAVVASNYPVVTGSGDDASSVMDREREQRASVGV